MLSESCPLAEHIRRTIAVYFRADHGKKLFPGNNRPKEKHRFRKILLTIRYSQ